MASIKNILKVTFDAAIFTTEWSKTEKLSELFKICSFLSFTNCNNVSLIVVLKIIQLDGWWNSGKKELQIAHSKQQNALKRIFVFAIIVVVCARAFTKHAGSVIVVFESVPNQIQISSLATRVDKYAKTVCENVFVC